MNTINRCIATASLVAFVGLASQGTLRADEAAPQWTLKPMVQAGVAVITQQSLLDLTLGTKQVLSYFHTENGRCKLTVMVAQAFNGGDVPSSPTVRFEVAISARMTARMGTAAGRSLEFACGGSAQEMHVKAETPKLVYASGM